MGIRCEGASLRSLNDKNKEIVNESVYNNKNIEIGNETFDGDAHLDEDDYNDESINRKNYNIKDGSVRQHG